MKARAYVVEWEISDGLDQGRTRTDAYDAQDAAFQVEILQATAHRMPFPGREVDGVRVRIRSVQPEASR